MPEEAGASHKAHRRPWRGEDTLAGGGQEAGCRLYASNWRCAAVGRLHCIPGAVHSCVQGAGHQPVGRAVQVRTGKQAFACLLQLSIQHEHGAQQCSQAFGSCLHAVWYPLLAIFCVCCCPAFAVGLPPFPAAPTLGWWECWESRSPSAAASLTLMCVHLFVCHAAGLPPFPAVPTSGWWVCWESR